MLNKLELEPIYKTPIYDVIDDFYIPCLYNAKKYYRVAAYFDSKALAFYCKGIEGLLKKQGKYDLIISESISEFDYNQILMGYDMKSRKINDMLRNFDDIKLNKIDEARISNLSYLISIGLIDIKVAFTKEGIFHDKFGIFEDEEGNIVYFRGSNNETGAAIKKNYESFEVTTNWDCGFNEARKIDYAKATFKNLWNDNESGVYVVSFTDAIMEKIAKYNQGGIVMEKNAYFEKLIEVDYIENKVICNNYSNIKFSTKDFFVKKHFQRLLESIDDKQMVFLEMLNYTDVKKLLAKIEKFCDKKGLVFRLTEKLKTFLKSKDLQIEKRSRLGIDIKNQEESVKNAFGIFEKTVNRELERQLRPLQMWGAFHICMMNKAANFSVPGTGKTSIVYGAYSFLSSSDKKEVDKVVVIGPKNSFLAWKDEFGANFGNKRMLNCYDIHKNASNKKDRLYDLRYLSGDKNLILINYESMGSLETVLNEIIDESTLLVFDEVHKVKAIDGERAKVALRISQKAKYKVVLTGTPIPNGYTDIYNMFNILYHDEYKDYFGYDTRDLKNPREELIKEINNKIFPFYCRATKDDLNIPQPEPDIIIQAEMTSLEMDLFKLIYTKLSKNVLELYIRLIQASTNPELLYDAIDSHELEQFFPELQKEDDGKSFECSEGLFEDMRDLIDKIGTTTKFNKGIELITQLLEEGKPVLVWSLFVKTIRKIERRLSSKGYKVKIIDGSIPLEEREEIINEFKKGKIDVIVTNPNTMAESVSLHTICHDAIYFEYNFNLTHMLQSRDRINRLGLAENQYTRYYYMMLDNNHIRYNSIDRKIYDRLKEKEMVMLEAIEGNSLRRVDFNDIDDILSILQEELR